MFFDASFAEDAAPARMHGSTIISRDLQTRGRVAQHRYHGISNRYYFTLFAAIGLTGFHRESACGGTRKFKGRKPAGRRCYESRYKRGPSQRRPPKVAATNSRAKSTSPACLRANTRPLQSQRKEHGQGCLCQVRIRRHNSRIASHDSRLTNHCAPLTSARIYLHHTPSLALGTR
jgi:hypothetical protein